MFPRPKRRLYDAVRKFEEDTHLPSSLMRRRWQSHSHLQRRVSLFESVSGLKWFGRTEAYSRLDISRLESWGRKQITSEMKYTELDDGTDAMSDTVRSDVSGHRVSYLLYYDVPHSEFIARRVISKTETTERGRIETLLRISKLAASRMSDMLLRFKALVKRELLERSRTEKLQQSQWTDFIQVQQSELASVAHGWGKPKRPQVPTRPKHALPRAQISFSGCPFKNPYECVFFASSQFDIGHKHFKKNGFSELCDIDSSSLPPDLREKLHRIVDPLC